MPRTKPTKPPFGSYLWFGDIALKVSIGAAMLGLAIWLFAPDSWFSGKTAAAIALFVMPAGFIVYGATRLLAHYAGGNGPNSN